MKNLTKCQLQLLDLVSIALFGGEEVKIPLTQELGEEAYQQAVLNLLGLQLDTTSVLNELNTQGLANNVRIDYEHSEVHKLMSEAKIPYVILKGSASASYYPEPLLRTMGDVDFLVSPSDVSKAEWILRKNGFQAGKDNNNDCHMVYRRHTYGVISTWEMHWEPSGIPNGEVGNLIREYFSDIITEAKKCNVSGSEYMIPSTFHHGLIMLLHVAVHMINSGIGLRHLCDWTVFVAKLTEEEFCELFEKKLKTIGLWKFAQVLTQLSVKYLKCPVKKWCLNGDDDYLETVMVDIMDAGNFGTKDKNRINQAKLITNTGKGYVDDTSLLKQFILTMNEKSKRCLPIVLKIPLLLPIGWIYVGVRHLVRIAQRKRPSIDVGDMITGATERKNIYREFRLFEKE